jgi:histone H3/H4
MPNTNTIFVIASRVKELNKDAGFNTSAEYLESLSETVESLILRGQKRAKQNGRKTLMAQDA